MKFNSRCVPSGPWDIRKQAYGAPLIKHAHRQRHWTFHTAYWVTRAMLHTILEEKERAVIKVNEDTEPVALC